MLTVSFFTTALGFGISAGIFAMVVGFKYCAIKDAMKMNSVE